MRRAVALVATGLTLAGCASGAKHDVVSGPTYTQPQAAGALVLATDLPKGYTKDPEYRHDALPGGCGAVDKVLAKESELTPTFAVASFRNADTSSSVDHEVELYATPAQAAAQYDALIAALKACPSWTITLGTDSAKLSLTPSQPDVIGKRSAVLLLSVQAATGKVSGREVLAVTGNAVVSLAESGPLGSSDDPRVDLLTLTTKLVQRLRAEAA